MRVIVDSTVWSLAMRRKTATSEQAVHLARLIADDAAQIIGPIRQEVLSGIRDAVHFQAIRDRLAPFPDLPLSRRHFERAAEFSNSCRSTGIQGSPTDFLICAVSELYQMEIFTTDQDFERFAVLLPIRLPGI